MTNTTEPEVGKNFRLDRNTQSVEELWKSIADLANGRVKDNESGEYPLSIRRQQVVDLLTLVLTLKESHKKMK